jgi:NADH-quinone oxidoreductase subunit L
MYIVKTELPGLVVARCRPIYLFLYNKWYFDELYDAIFVRPAKALGYALWRDGDGALIDGLGPDGVARVARNLAERASRLQTGYVYHYAFAMLIGVAGLISFYLLTRGG